MTEYEASRRNLLYGIAAAGAAVPVLVACGSEDASTPTGSASNPGGGSTPTSTASEGGSPEPAGIPTSDIPVGGGAIYPDEKVVITQPTEGTFKAFDITCTHSGCPVTEVTDGTINCPCHGSRYSIEDGSVEGGPAPRPLAAKTVKVTGTSLTVS